MSRPEMTGKGLLTAIYTDLAGPALAIRSTSMPETATAQLEMNPAVVNAEQRGSSPTGS